MSYQITASIVAYKTSPGDLARAMDSFLDNDLSKKLIIIDHSPTDALKNICRRNNTEYYHHPENRGFGAGHNIAIRKIINESPYHLVLNPDVYFDNNVVAAILSYLDTHHDVAHLMPRIINEKGETQYLAKLLPTPLDLIFKRFLSKSLSEKRLQKFQLRFTDYNSVMNVPYLSGCCMLLRTEALQTTGLFDERFFMYPEDIDLTRRLHRNYKTVYYPYVSITHRHAASSYKSFKMLRIHAWNLIKYFNKWGWVADEERKTINKRTLQNLGYIKQ